MEIVKKFEKENKVWKKASKKLWQSYISFNHAEKKLIGKFGVGWVAWCKAELMFCIL
jgi:hypothetical protein